MNTSGAKGASTCVHDSVVGLPNHLWFCEMLEQAIRSAERGHRVGLALVALDHFKEINATLGYHRANELLGKVGSRLKNEFGDSAMVATLRTNEFAILLRSAQNTQDAIEVVERILRWFERPFQLSEISLEIQASIGCAYFPEHATTADALIQRAHVALLAAKRRYSRVAIYSPEQELNNAQDLAIVGGLRQAIADEQLFLLYQPKLDFRQSRVVGVEALARWKHPKFGLIPPDRFIPLAEKTGLTPQLTQWAFQEAVRQCKVWHDERLDISMAINLSMHDLQAPGFIDRVAKMLASSGVPSNRLIFEITESAIMANPKRAMESAKRIKGMGIRLSIDDFGTGYSSLDYLRKLPADEIKIDKSFVMNVTTRREEMVIVRALINLGHELKAKMVAEGVEDEETMDVLGELGCDSAQGYYISRPLPPSEFTAFMDKSALIVKSSLAVKPEYISRLSGPMDAANERVEPRVRRNRSVEFDR